VEDQPDPKLSERRISRRKLFAYSGAGATLLAATRLGGPLGARAVFAEGDDDGPGSQHNGNGGNRSWRAGDHHIHSEYSVEADTSVNPPKLIIGGDAVYPIVTNAIMAKNFGLQWMVCTDHGGPTHSKLNLQTAYPDLVRSRALVPDVLQYWGMEFDAPAMDHHTLIIPRTPGEAQQLYSIESQYSKRDPFPSNPSWDTEAHMMAALQFMNSQAAKPLMFANHTSRSASGLGVYGQDTPREFRAWNNLAPDIYHGFEGAPGHQAGPLVGGARGAFGNHHTYGGFDQMTARVGGLWDSLLGEGRRWWITATSDSHVHWTRGGSDFWPGEYSKTYVLARRDYDDVLDGLRSGRIWVTTGDLISGLEVVVSGPGGRAGISEALDLRRNGKSVDVEIRFRPLAGKNGNGETPVVSRVDLITGGITGPSADVNADTNPTARVVARFGPNSWRRSGDEMVIRHRLTDIPGNMYVRVRGTNTAEDEPQLDGAEDPWTDLWFYSNPVFIRAS